MTAIAEFVASLPEKATEVLPPVLGLGLNASTEELHQTGPGRLTHEGWDLEILERDGFYFLTVGSGEDPWWRGGQILYYDEIKAYFPPGYAPIFPGAGLDWSHKGPMVGPYQEWCLHMRHHPAARTERWHVPPDSEPDHHTLDGRRKVLWVFAPAGKLYEFPESDPDGINVTNRFKDFLQIGDWGSTLPEDPKYLNMIDGVTKQWTILKVGDLTPATSPPPHPLASWVYDYGGDRVFPSSSGAPRGPIQLFNTRGPDGKTGGENCRYWTARHCFQTALLFGDRNAHLLGLALARHQAALGFVWDGESSGMGTFSDYDEGQTRYEASPDGWPGNKDRAKISHWFGTDIIWGHYLSECPFLGKAVEVMRKRLLDSKPYRSFRAYGSRHWDRPLENLLAIWMGGDRKDGEIKARAELCFDQMFHPVTGEVYQDELFFSKDKGEKPRTEGSNDPNWGKVFGNPNIGAWQHDGVMRQCILWLQEGVGTRYEDKILHMVRYSTRWHDADGVTPLTWDTKANLPVHPAAWSEDPKSAHIAFSLLPMAWLAKRDSTYAVMAQKLYDNLFSNMRERDWCEIERRKTNQLKVNGQLQHGFPLSKWFPVA